MQIILLLLCLFLCCHGNLLSVDEVTGEVYWATRNWLTRMSSNLTVLEKVATGPELYHPDCQHPYEPCEFERVPTDFEPLVISTFKLNDVILCGTIYNGLCQLRFKEDLATGTWIGPFNNSYALTASGPSRILEYWGSGYLTVSSYTPGPGPKPAFVAIKFLVMNPDKKEPIFVNFDGPSTMYFTDEKQRTVIYAQVVNGTNNYTVLYVLFTEDGVRTVLLRLFLSRYSIKSATEIEVACGSSNLATSASLAKIPDSEIYEFFVIFKESESRPSEICSARKTLLELAFEMAIFRCLNSKPDSSIIFTGGLSYQNTTENTIMLCKSDNVQQWEFDQDRHLKDFKAEREWSEVSHFYMYYMHSTYYEEGVMPPRWMLYDLYGKGVYRAIVTPWPYSQLIERKNHSRPSMAVNEKTVYISDDKVVSRYTIGECGFHFECRNCTANSRCTWCQDTCKPKDWCTFNPTPCKPKITTVTPETLKMFVSHRIFIEGTNFRSMKGTITISSIECLVNLWEDDFVECSFPVASATDPGTVVLKTYDRYLAFSNETVSFEKPRIFGVYPVKGPSSGGTNVTIFGENLNLANITALVVGGTPCTLTQVTKQALSCTTRPRRHRDRGIVSVTMEDYSVPYTIHQPQDARGSVSDFFQYISDPEIHSIRPNKRKMRGSTPVIVSGSNLNAVLSPRMLVLAPTLSGKIVEIEEPCTASDGKTMTCSTPDLFERNENFTSSEPLVCHLAFIMDGVTALRYLPRTQEKLSRFVYYPEPEYVFYDHPLYVGIGKDEVVLEGQFLNMVYDEDTTKVIVGNEIPCKVVSLNEKNLTCKMSHSFLSDSSLLGKKFRIQVLTDTSRRTVGYLILTAVNFHQIDGQLVALVSGLGAVIIAVIAVWIYIKRRERRSKRLSGPPKENGEQKEAVVESTPLVPLTDLDDAKDWDQLDQQILNMLHTEGLLIRRDSLKIGKVVAEGEFGRVYEGYFGNPEDDYLLKVALKTTKGDSTLHVERWRELVKEAHLMKDFLHTNVLHLIGLSFHQGKPLIVVPFMHHGDLHSYVKDPEHVLTVGDLLQFSYHIACGMAYISSKDFVHRDLAARNCMFTGNNRAEWTVKVADFGLSRNVKDSKLYKCADQKDKLLPYKWMAPECIQKGTYTEKTDVWSYGIVLWELMTRCVNPYASVQHERLPYFLEEGKRLPRPEYSSEELDALMLRCWLYTPEERPLFREIESDIKQIWEECMKDPDDYEWKTKAQNSRYLTDYANRSPPA